MIKIIKILLVPLLFTACTQSMLITGLPAEKGGHLQYGYDNTRKFNAPFTISDSLKLKWSFSTHGSYNNSSIIAYDKYMFTHDLSGNICCFDLLNGNDLGTITYNGAIYSTPVIYKSRMFFIVNNAEEKYSTAYYYDLQDGKKLSEVKIDGSFFNQILKNDNAFFTISDNGGIFEFNLGGFNDWKYDTGVKVLSTPALVNGTIIFCSLTGELIVFDFNQKIIKVNKKIGSGFYGGITIDGKYGYTGDGNGVLYCFSVDKGEVVWKGNTGSKIIATPILNDSYVYITNLSGIISCFDKKNGSLKWKTKITGAPASTPILFNNYLLQPNLDSYLYFINTTDGKVAKRQKFSGRMKMTPVLYNGLLFFGYDKGNIDAFEITEVK